jgi:hypothetical protein
VDESIVIWLERWYQAHCNGDWEHRSGIKIETLDNPGWVVRIDLDGTEMADKPFVEPQLAPGVDGDDWLVCRVQDGVFEGYGGPHKLGAILGVFCDWCERYSDWHAPLSPDGPGRYPCPCCGYLVFDDGPGSYDVCPICFWEDDLVQLRFADMAGGANAVSLRERQRNYATVGACEEGAVGYVRQPTADDQRDAGWRPLDPAQDNIEDIRTVTNAAQTYPEDLTKLYYWRDTYWRR